MFRPVFLTLSINNPSSFIDNIDIRLLCLISYREGLSTSLYIMGLATIDPRGQKADKL